MISDIERLLDDYAKWLRDKTILREVSDWVEITTPYLDRHNDYLQIYARKDNGGYILTDDGYIIEDLVQSGCRIDTAKRQQLLEFTLNGFGVDRSGNALATKANVGNFAMKKHNLIQSMLAVNDLFFLAAPVVMSLFIEDVTAWLDSNEVRYTPRVKFTGKSGFDHVFDLVVPKSRRAPERILRAINRPSRDTAESFAFSWLDTREIRAPDSRAMALLNDREGEVSSGVLEALSRYEIAPIRWSEREASLPELAA